MDIGVQTRKLFFGQLCSNCKYLDYYHYGNKKIYMCNEYHRMCAKGNTPTTDGMYAMYIERDARDCCEYWSRK